MHHGQLIAQRSVFRRHLNHQYWIEQGLTSHQTHYRSYWGRVFMGQMT